MDAPAVADRPAEVADVARLARRAVRGVLRTARADETAQLGDLVAAHLGTAAVALSVVEESWPAYDHVNVQAGLDAWLPATGRTHELVGIVGFQHNEFGLADLTSQIGHRGHPHGPRPGHVSRVNLSCGPDGATKAVVQCGLYLVADGTRRTVVLLRGPLHNSMHETVSIYLASSDPQFAVLAATELRELATEHNVFRAQVLSFGSDVFGHGQALLRFHRRESLDESRLILPAHTRAAVERQVVGVARHRARLLAAGQHLKRGLLLYGPPGVGKTHTVRYLTGRLIDTTVIQLSGDSIELIGRACSIARVLQPAMLIIEDVDLIAEERGHYEGANPLLFQLLNEMDGLAEDADVVFVLTTNRADLLEPALAQRPGRIDQAVELSLPDEEARRALFQLYRGSLPVDTSRLDGVLARTEGVTASFLKELLRRAATQAAERSGTGAIEVTADDLDTALAELLDTRNAMTRTLLGGAAHA